MCKVNVKYRSLELFKTAKSYETTLVVITQPLSLHYVFISYNMKPYSLEFMYLEREDSYTRQVCPGCKIWILNEELWGIKSGGAWPFIGQPPVWKKSQTQIIGIKYTYDKELCCSVPSVTWRLDSLFRHIEGQGWCKSCHVTVSRLHTLRYTRSSLPSH